jgi:serine protease Do
LAKSFKLPDTQGALVAYVEAGSPADQAGLKEGDFVTTIAGKPVANQMALREMVAQLEPGKETPIEFYRDGQKRTATVKVVPRPQGGEGPQTQPDQEQPSRLFGIAVQTLGEDMARQLRLPSGLKGVLVTQVAPDSDAADQGLERGMVVTHVQDRQVGTPQEFYDALGAAGKEGVRIRVAGPGGGYRFLFVRPKVQTQ